jgi:hypothetical protein
VRTADGTREAKLELDQRTRIALDRATLKASAVSSRGAVEQSFRLHLYEEPFDSDYYRGYIAAEGSASVGFDAPRWRPGPADRDLIDVELRRLNGSARDDAALRRRLTARRVEIVRAIEASQYDKALKLLRSVETGQ